MNREPESGIGVWFGVSRIFPDACHNCHSFSRVLQDFASLLSWVFSARMRIDIIRWPETPPVLFLVHFLRELLLNFPVAVRQAKGKNGRNQSNSGSQIQLVASYARQWQSTQLFRSLHCHFKTSMSLPCHFISICLNSLSNLVNTISCKLSLYISAPYQ